MVSWSFFYDGELHCAKMKMEGRTRISSSQGCSVQPSSGIQETAIEADGKHTLSGSGVSVKVDMVWLSVLGSGSREDETIEIRTCLVGGVCRTFHIVAQVKFSTLP